ncbi:MULTISPECIES: sel1 repeat family protein [unclassified Legionella]|uniref:sel1 repeat family protein n=1 Tax=unclassified Legionella TaxID=2622702 RepID=UPI001056684E|nr:MULTISPECIES: sel1 repeat family protein [unclassified Legionella]MDI9818233.1 sel1 repeat family protein [Legionella sp. PL877]
MFFKRFKIRRLTKKLKAMQQSRIHNQPRDEILAKEISYYHELAAIYETLIGHKKYPFAEEMMIACLRAAGTLDDSSAQYQVAKKLLEEAKFRQRLQLEGLFASPSNERQMKQLYEEALVYLQAAEKLGHIQAKRLHGLCYINGWGVESDKEKGFELVVASIEQENSWDRVPQIFASIGLNKPEFFAAIMKHRHKQ